jgi:hypothetical protein
MASVSDVDGEPFHVQRDTVPSSGHYTSDNGGKEGDYGTHNCLTLSRFLW